MQKLIAKVIIKGKIVTETGLHIGGSKSALDIGGVDLNVIKSPKGLPFIPGSSLKGKMRTLLAKIEGSVAVSQTSLDEEDRGKGLITDETLNSPYIIELFGSSGDSDDDSNPARLITRDAYLDEVAFKTTFENIEMELGYSDVKFENTIDRKRGTAKHPRQLERIPAGAEFSFELIYDLYDDASDSGKLKKHLWAIQTAMQLLEDDYLGGHGSRGYGKISFKNIEVNQKNIEINSDYTVGEKHELVQKFTKELNKFA